MDSKTKRFFRYLAPNLVTLSSLVFGMPKQAIALGADDAARAARLYKEVAWPRGREIDLAIAACAISHGASLWTLNRSDFSDIPDLVLAD